MKVQVNSDKQVTVGAELVGVVQGEVERVLERFESQLTRVEVHLSDLNSSKPGILDKRCLLEVRPAGKKPVSSDHVAPTIEQAVRGAAGKMKRLLQTSFGKVAKRNLRGSAGLGKRALDSRGALEQLDQIEAALAVLSDEPDNESPQFEQHVRTATDALQRARLLIEASQQKTDEPRPAKTAAPKRAGISKKKATAPPGRISADGRSPKKKGIYRARRKSWPKR